MKRKSYIMLLSAVFIASAMMAFAQDDIKQSSSCKYCGMDREKFSHSRMHIEYEDGTTVGTCSLHCAAVDLALTIDKTPKVVWAADYSSKKLIDAEKAIWVIGGDMPGVMTKQAKWAFESKASAESFVKEHGGAIVTFEDAVKSAYEDMYQDTKMIREKRKMKKKESMEHIH